MGRDEDNRAFLSVFGGLDLPLSWGAEGARGSPGKGRTSTHVCCSRRGSRGEGNGLEARGREVGDSEEGVPVHRAEAHRATAGLRDGGGNLS